MLMTSVFFGVLVQFFDSVMQTGRWFIATVKPSGVCNESEIKYHLLKKFLSSHIPKSFPLMTWLLIRNNTGIYDINQGSTEVISVKEKVANRLQVTGGLASQIASNRYSVNLDAGEYATATISKSWKQVSGLDQKEILIERCKVEAIDLPPYLKLNVGLEMSICTGNASRMTLWDAVCFSFATRDEAGSFFCDHHVADFDCAVRCWGQESPSLVKYDEHDLPDSEQRRPPKGARNRSG